MIEVINRQKRFRINLGNFKRLLRRLVRHYGLNQPEIALAFVDNPEIQDLNKRFRKKDMPTDVLSFPLNEKAADGKFYLGDIVISVPKANEHAAELKHDLKRELEDLTVHGFLHLLGYTHSRGHEEEEGRIRSLLLKN